MKGKLFKVILGTLAFILFAGGLAFLSKSGNSVGTWLITPHRGEASTSDQITITHSPTWCQEGTWVIGNFTYIGKRCVNYPTPTPNPCYRSDFHIADPWTGEEFKWIPYVPDIKLNAKAEYSWQKLHIGDCVYWVEGYTTTVGNTFVCEHQGNSSDVSCWLSQTPIPTPTPTPQCYRIRSYFQYYPNTSNTEPPWSAKFDPMAFNIIPQSYLGCDDAAIQKVQYWNPDERKWIEGTWGLTDFNYWKGVYTDLLEKEYEAERLCKCNP